MPPPTAWLQRLHCLPIEVLIGVAALCAITSQHLYSAKSELWSEILCWTLLPVLLHVASGPDTKTGSKPATLGFEQTRPASSGPLWIAAVGVVAACLSKVEDRNAVGLYPALIPLLLAAQSHFRPGFHIWRTNDSSLLSPFVHTLWGTCLIASLQVFVLSPHDFGGLIWPIVSLVASTVAYAALLPSSTTNSNLPRLVNLDAEIVPLSRRIIILLLFASGTECLVYGFHGSPIVPTALSGLAKVFYWYSTLRITRITTWSIAPAIGTFGIMAKVDPFTMSSEAEILFRLGVSILPLCQIIHMVPQKATRARWALWLMALFPLLPYLADLSAVAIVNSSIPLTFSRAHGHPVEALAEDAEAKFQALLRRQSHSYSAAHSEYQRRYGVQPPPGFDAWYDFAMSKASPIIDDFDVIYNAISPFWAISGKEVLKVMSDAQNTPDSELWLCEVSGRPAKIHCRHPHRTFDRHISLLFDKLLEAHGENIPNVKFLVNHLDEPRVLIPPRPLAAKTFGSELLNLTNLSHRSVWDRITKFCTFQRSSRASGPWSAAKTFGLPFVTDSSSSWDLCQHSEYKEMHGLFMSPTSFRLVEGLVPILSTGAPSTMGDIPFPSPAYTEPEFQFEGGHDIDWERKRRNLYWAGSTTGAFATDNKWPSYHRQRFVELAQNLKRQKHGYLREIDVAVGLRKSLFLNGRLFDVAFTRVFQCKRQPCRDQRAYFNIRAWEDSSKAFQSQLVFDIDGNGISGRYYKLLASNSVPLKQTLLREWHDDRLIPWVHYIPVSQSMEELPELVTYLTSTESGQRRAKRIADRGRDWHRQALREDDLHVYMYRLLLELARLQDPKRPRLRDEAL